MNILETGICLLLVFLFLMTLYTEPAATIEFTKSYVTSAFVVGGKVIKYFEGIGDKEVILNEGRNV